MVGKITNDQRKWVIKQYYIPTFAPTLYFKLSRVANVSLKYLSIHIFTIDFRYIHLNNIVTVTLQTPRMF
jgi:hypothetical protein